MSAKENKNLEYKVLNMQGKEVGKINLEPFVFASDINEGLVHQVVTWQRNAKRQGTHSTLNRAKIKASNKKPYKQKSTGRARRGSDVSPLLVGGAVIFGPQPKSYATRLNKKMRAQALTSALTSKVVDKKLIILDELKTDGKTKTLTSALNTLGVVKGGVLLVSDKSDQLVNRSARNLQKVVPMPVTGVNVYDLIKHKFLVCTKSGVEALQNKISKVLVGGGRMTDGN